VISVPVVILACIFVALGRRQIRRAPRREDCGVLRRVWAWGVLALGFGLMIVGVLLWGNTVN